MATSRVAPGVLRSTALRHSRPRWSRGSDAWIHRADAILREPPPPDPTARDGGDAEFAGRTPAEEAGSKNAPRGEIRNHTVGGWIRTIKKLCGLLNRRGSGIVEG